MNSRQQQLNAFLDSAAIVPVEINALAQDASFRRYFRVKTDSGSLLVMDAPPQHEDLHIFVKVANHLRRIGVRAPAIIDQDIDSGFLLLEDFGNETFTRLLNNGGDAESLYRQAIKVLTSIHRHPQSASIELAAYDDGLLMTEATLLVEWFGKCGETERSSYEAAWKKVFDALPPIDNTLVLRDYHVDNLMIAPPDHGFSGCAVLDFQDAVIGSPAYDMVSLLEDARRDVQQGFVSGCLDYYFRHNPQMHQADFMVHYSVLGAQRHAKVLGIFCRLRERDAKPQYLKHLPRVGRLFLRSLDSPILMPVRQWQQRVMPDILQRCEQLARV